MSSNQPNPSSYVCDTLPAARLATASTEPQPNRSDEQSMVYEQAAILDEPDVTPKQHEQDQDQDLGTPPPAQPPPRKLCVRHQRMADEGVNLKLQQSLDALPIEEREAVNAVWTNFSSSSHPRRALILQGLLTMCCFSQLSLLTEQLAQLIRIDPFVVLPREIALKILGHLDATSLCRAAQVSTRWRGLADDDVLWRGICEQHIGQKCRKCGWGLPILEKKRCYLPQSPSSPHSPNPVAPLALPSISLNPASPDPTPASSSSTAYSSTVSQGEPIPSTSFKRSAADSSDLLARPLKRQRSDNTSSDASSSSRTRGLNALLVAPDQAADRQQQHDQRMSQSLEPPSVIRRPWKAVYSERMTIERNWRRGRHTVRTLKGHTDGVMCLQFNESLSHPAFPVLITGSYDRTVRVWNLETGQELHCLKGHTRAVRALQFDEVKLITGSMDNTLKVWDWRRGKCIRTLTGHTEGVVCLNFDSNVLASGSVDATIKVWNLRTGGAFTLRGHTDWVNSVQLWDSSSYTSEFDSSSLLSRSYGSGWQSPNSQQQQSQIDPGKMLFSASDDGTIRLWDLTLRTCVRMFTGHVGQVQSMKLLLSDECGGSDTPDESADASPDQSTTNSGAPSDKNNDTAASSSSSSSAPKRKKPLLISGSLDNTIRLWDIETGTVTQTLFGHIEGVWDVACDKLRLVSASHDRTIKVWNREDGKCTTTLVGHQAAVSCIALGEDKIVSGSDDNDIKIWNFS